MLRNILGFFLTLLVVGVYGQGGPSASQLPQIDLVLTDGARFTNQNLTQGPFVLIYFSPDCDHCKQFITSMLQREKLAKSKPMVLASFVAINTLRDFEQTMGLKKFSNIRIGTEGESYRIARALGIRKFPYIALYDSSKRLVRYFEGEDSISGIAAEIERLR